jgi:hypothetical protein
VARVDKVLECSNFGNMLGVVCHFGTCHKKMKKMKKILITIILTVVSYQLFSQVDSVEQQILNYDDARSVIISKGRSLLLDKFLENDMEKVREIKNYLIEKGEDENYIALYTAELWLILYWTNEYEELLTNVKNFENTKMPLVEYHIYPTTIRRYYSTRYDNRIFPSPDMLYTKLLQYSQDNKDEIIIQIQDSEIEIEKKRFLQLNFESLIKKDNSYQDALNTQADSFRESFPESEYNDYIGKYIKYKYVLGTWGAALEIFFGMGFPTGEFRNRFIDDVTFGVALDVYYKKFEFLVRMIGGSFHLKKDIEYSKGYYPKDSAMTVFLPELSCGYAVFENHRIKLAPFAGIGGFFVHTSLKKRKEIQELKELSVSAFAFNFGTSFDIRFSKKPQYKYYPNSFDLFLRIRYNFCLPVFSNKYDAINGQLHTVTIGLGGFSRASKREY